MLKNLVSLLKCDFSKEKSSLLKVVTQVARVAQVLVYFPQKQALPEEPECLNIIKE